eukprot:g4418.t1
MGNEASRSLLDPAGLTAAACCSSNNAALQSSLELDVRRSRGQHGSRLARLLQNKGLQPFELHVGRHLVQTSRNVLRFPFRSDVFVRLYESDVFAEKYDVGIELGRGSFGVVQAARSKGEEADGGVAIFSSGGGGKKTPHPTFAVKSWEETNSRAQENFYTERDALLQIDHPHVVKLFEVHEVLSASSLRLVCEQCSGGELYGYVAGHAQRGEFIPEAEAQIFVFQMCLALNYLHVRCGIVHRDVKTENWLFAWPPASSVLGGPPPAPGVDPAYRGLGLHTSSTGSIGSGAFTSSSSGGGTGGNVTSSSEDNSDSEPHHLRGPLLLTRPRKFHLKLCDFGTAVKERDAVAQSRVGTLSYTAPEVYFGKAATRASDMWSLGVCVFVLLCGQSPFRSKPSSGGGTYPSNATSSSSPRGYNKPSSTSTSPRGQTPGPREVRDTVERIKRCDWDKSKIRHVTASAFALVDKLLRAYAEDRASAFELLTTEAFVTESEGNIRERAGAGGPGGGMKPKESNEYQLHVVSSTPSSAGEEQRSSTGNTVFSSASEQVPALSEELRQLLAKREADMTPLDNLGLPLVTRSRSKQRWNSSSKESRSRSKEARGGKIYNTNASTSSSSSRRNSLEGVLARGPTAATSTGAQQVLNPRGQKLQVRPSAGDPFGASSDYMTPVSVSAYGNLIREKYLAQLLRLLVAYGQLNGLQKMALVSCAKCVADVAMLAEGGDHHLPWYELFLFFDRDRDGVLGVPEFVRGLHELLQVETGVSRTDFREQISTATLHKLVSGLCSMKTRTTASFAGNNGANSYEEIDSDFSRRGISWAEWLALERMTQPTPKLLAASENAFLSLQAVFRTQQTLDSSLETLTSVDEADSVCLLMDSLQIVPAEPDHARQLRLNGLFADKGSAFTWRHFVKLLDFSTADAPSLYTADLFALPT